MNQAKPVEFLGMFNPFTYTAVVDRVIDGDTVDLHVDLGFGSWLHSQRFRLVGINAPEVRGEEREEGLKVKEYLQEVLPVGHVVLVRSFKDARGKYGRWLGDIILRSGQSISQDLLNKGMAEVWK